MDQIFKALNDASRRRILDSLRQKDGQCLSDLAAQHTISRYAIMQHIKVLEDANLVISRKSGRFKYLYLNALPLQEMIDRWVEPLIAAPSTRTVLNLKSKLEGNSPMAEKPDLVLSTYIRTTLDALWQAATNGEIVAQHHFASDTITGNYEQDGVVEFIGPEGQVLLRNKVLSITPKTRLEMTFAPGGTEDESRISRCVYLLEEQGPLVKLTVEHYDTGPGHDHVLDGWNRYLSGIKTWMETGTAAFA